MTSDIPVTLEEHRFVAADFVGGTPALDFINTVTGRDVRARDWLPDFYSLASWAAARGVLNASEHDRLTALAADASLAGHALHRAKVLREAMHRLATGGPGSSADLELLTREWRASVQAGTLSRSDENGVTVEPPWSGLDTITSRMAADFVASGRMLSSDRLRTCSGINCGWAFLDRSKAGRRRWCDMATCGNVSKGRRHRSRNAVRP